MVSYLENHHMHIPSLNNIIIANKFQYFCFCKINYDIHLFIQYLHVCIFMRTLSVHNILHLNSSVTITQIKAILRDLTGVEKVTFLLSPPPP